MEEEEAAVVAAAAAEPAAMEVVEEPPAAAAAAVAEGGGETLTVAEVDKMKVADLKTALTERGLATTGLKAELAARLREHVEGS